MTNKGRKEGAELPEVDQRRLSEMEKEICESSDDSCSLRLRTKQYGSSNFSSLGPEGSASPPEPNAEEDLTLVDSDTNSVDGVPMDTIKRNIKPARPPRNIDHTLQGVSQTEGRTEYYNLCHPPPHQPSPVPTIPRRKPVISHPSLGEVEGKEEKHIQRQTQPTSTQINVANSASWKPQQISSNTWTSQPRSRCTSRSSAAGETCSMASQRTGRRKIVNKPRRKGSVCHCKETGSLVSPDGKDTVVLMYSRHCTGSVEWARYLHKLFTELSRHKDRLTVRHLPVEDLATLGSCTSLPPSLESEVQNSRLQLVIVSPVFLQWVASHPAYLVGRLLQQERVIALLLGVREEQVTAEHRSSLVSFPQWVHLEARDHDLEFVQTVLYFSTQILNRGEDRAGAGCAKGVGQNIARGQESLAFTIFPRKVTESQCRVVLMLDKPLTSRSVVRVVVDIGGGPSLKIDEVKIKNPFTLMINVPPCLFARSCLVNLYLEVDKERKGFRQLKCESRPHELDTLLSAMLDPLEFLCQSLAIAPSCRDQLDQRLTANLLANIPHQGFPLLSFSTGDRDFEPQDGQCPTLYPTLLHFSASHGLDQLTSALLDCPGSNHALRVPNSQSQTPCQMAREAGHHDIAEIIQAHQQEPPQFSHIYDYIKQTNDRPVSSQLSDYAGPDPAYKVPPPPRPLVSTPSKTNGNYLDMSGSNTPSPCPHRRAKPQENKSCDIFGQVGLQPVAQSTMARYNLEAGINRLAFGHQDLSVKNPTSNTRHLYPSETQQDTTVRQNDPFGTMRGASTRRSLKECTKPQQKERLYVNDPFGTLRASRASSAPKSISSDEVFCAEENTKELQHNKERARLENSRPDYRGVPLHQSPETETAGNLAVTEELLEMLEDFKNKSYTVKEMESMFDSWRRKASLPPTQTKEPKVSKEVRPGTRSAYSLLKLFRGGSNGNNEGPSNGVRRTQGSKQFLRPSSGEQGGEQEPLPPLDENELHVVELPPTPLKTDDASLMNGYSLGASGLTHSTQILPLHRLSGSTLPTSTMSTLNRSKPVAEVSPFSNAKPDTQEETKIVPPPRNMRDGNTTSDSIARNTNLVGTDIGARQTVNNLEEERGQPQPPSRGPVVEVKSTGDKILRRQHSAESQQGGVLVRQQLQKMRRSITEPLLQYFHDIHMTSPELEEPDILNTPKSIVDTMTDKSVSGKRLSRKLFGVVAGPLVASHRHSAHTSQIHEYQNISPTPSTDL